ncbi:NAD(P)H-quinone oxidoreductase subunit F [Gloeobacter kilaueensis]|uniref:NAD(P)H-quinone oxidoreductase subunit F n=1 Tax=Gloeobacter kilaueensis (strain ATCC BAA-2537 / CCAP 1431/1 / ULC 316 / JS1) TaxID=1183438 RepID=U5QMM2_GLOK1|nr:NAD(P)H-quinone oxidoreductase subunit F [Gloeobacter kilaueensis]AGY60252.1 NAD(P)H-quinone oxidoreductase subunit F [Gloeobacter kilaueensis JS1]
MFMSAVESVWLVPCYPLVGAISALLWFPGIIRRTGPRPAGYVNVVTTLLAFSHSLLALIGIWGQPAREISFTWLHLQSLTLAVPVEISTLTVGALVLITGLNLLAQIYAIGYMEMDWGWARLFSFLGLFEAGMCGLVLCQSLFFSYFLLEILTLGTYLLVGFWFNQPLVVSGARDAFLTKRVGDLLLLMGVLALLPLAGSWNFSDLARWAATHRLDPLPATLIAVALIAGPVGKCAQFPLHLWLDEAMEGPLPASILRNALVVTTGAWVLVELAPVITISPFALALLATIGAISALGGTLISLAQTDTTRVLSYLVSAYMGIVFIAVAAGQTQTALLLVLSFSISMALLVMSIGSVVWNSVTQDLTQFGGLWSRRPLTALAFLVGGASLVALPPFAGFWPIVQLIGVLWTSQPVLAVLLVAVNALSAYALGRAFALIFLGKPQQMTERSPEVSWLMVLPMMALFGVALHLPIILWQLGLLPALSSLSVPAIVLLAVGSFGGGVLGIRLRLAALPWPKLQALFAYDFYMAEIYRRSVVFLVDSISRLVFLVDRHIVDGLVNLVGYASLFGGEGLKYSTNGRTQFYMLTILLGVVALGIYASVTMASSHPPLHTVGLALHSR